MSTHTAKAREAIATAEARIVSLKRKFSNGGTVSGADLAAARADLELAQSTVESARAKDAAEARADRERQSKVIAAEIAAYDEPDFAALVREVHTAVNALVSTVNEHNGHISRWSGRGASRAGVGVVGSDRRVKAPQTVSGLLKHVFVGGVTIATSDAAHVEAAVQAEAEQVATQQLGVRAMAQDTAPDWQKENRRRANAADVEVERTALTAFDQEAINAAELRHKRDEQGFPFDANRPDEPYPADIDRDDLVAHVPDLYVLNQMNASHARGDGFRAPGQDITRPGGAVLSDSPI